MYKIVYSILSLFLMVSLEAKNCKFDAGAGYRRDSFEWSLGGHERALPTLSKVSWHGLDIFEMCVQAKKITCQNIYMRASGDYGWIIRGKNRDSDFRFNTEKDKVEEFSRSDNDGGKGQVWDGSFGVGYFLRGIYGCLNDFRFVPLIGYSIHQQHLQMINGFQTIDLNNKDLEGHHFHHLHNQYKTRWTGPWVGVDAYFHWNDCITISGGFEFHWLRYQAHAKWNLRSDIHGHFEQEGNGQGYFANVGVDYNFINGWYLGGMIKFNYAHVKCGKDHRKVAGKLTPGRQMAKATDSDDEESSSSKSASDSTVIGVKTVNRLRNVKWNSFSLLFSIGYNF